MSSSHAGKSRGYNSRVAFYPEQDRAIVVLCNRDHLSPAGLSQLVNQIADNIEELIRGRPTTRIDFALASAQRAEDLRRSAASQRRCHCRTPEAFTRHLQFQV